MPYSGNSKKEVDGRSDVAFKVGEELKFIDRDRLLFSAGRSFRDSPSFVAYFGLQIILKGLGEGGLQDGKVQSEKN